MEAAIAQWICVRLTSWGHWFDPLTHHLCFFNLDLNCDEERTKRGRHWPIFKKVVLPIMQYVRIICLMPWQVVRMWMLDDKLNLVGIRTRDQVCDESLWMTSKCCSVPVQLVQRIGTKWRPTKGRSTPVWPDYEIIWTLGNFSKPLATIILPKLPIF